MTCAEADDRLEELHLDVLAPEEKRRVEEHLAGCSACRAAKEKVTAVESALRSARGSTEISPDEARRGLARARSQVSRPRKWLLLVPMAAALLFFGMILFWFVRPQPAAVPDWGIEIGYKFLPPKGKTESEYMSDLSYVIGKRVLSLGFNHEHFTYYVGRIEIKIPGATAEDAEKLKRLFRSMGHLELCPVAPEDIQRKFNLAQSVPEGYRVVEESLRSRGAEYDVYGGKVLIRNQSIIEGRQIVRAEAQQEMTVGGARWATAIELDAEGARRFDEAAATLYHQRPPGMIAIVMDGKVKSIPVVQSQTFHGRLQVSGSMNRQEAEDLAVILRSGVLPIPLGTRRDGVDIPGEPDLERAYGPKK